MKTDFQEFIKKVRWQKAKDNTHEYTVITWSPELTNEFREFVKTIYEKGVREKYKTTVYTYLTIDNYTYWSMNYRVEVTILINRKPVDNLPSQSQI